MGFSSFRQIPICEKCNLQTPHGPHNSKITGRPCDGSSVATWWPFDQNGTRMILGGQSERVFLLLARFTSEEGDAYTTAQIAQALTIPPDLIRATINGDLKDRKGIPIKGGEQRGG